MLYRYIFLYKHLFTYLMFCMYLQGLKIMLMTLCFFKKDILKKKTVGDVCDKG